MDRHKVLQVAAQLATILALLPGGYCAYGTYILLHGGVTQAPTAKPEIPVMPHAVNPTALLVSFVLFLCCFSVAAVLNLLNTFRRPALANEELGLPGSDINASGEEPSPAWVRFRSAYPEIAGPPAPGKEQAKKPQKARCEFLNCTDFSYKVKVLSWDSGSRGLDADFWRGCLQLLIGGSWCPEWNGVEELHVPPGESFRFWLFPKGSLGNDEFKARVNLGHLGTVHFLINGKEIALPVG